MGVDHDGVVVQGQGSQGILVFSTLGAPDIDEPVLRSIAHERGVQRREGQATHCCGVSPPLLSYRGEKKKTKSQKHDSRSSGAEKMQRGANLDQLFRLQIP